jgi:hypothetical protein
MNIFDTSSLWFNIAVNYIDWKVWAVLLIVVAVFTFQFWGTIWLALPLWLKVSLIFIVVAVLAYFAGRNTGSKNERDLQHEKDNQGEELRKKVDDTISTLDTKALDKRLDRWFRD